MATNYDRMIQRWGQEQVEGHTALKELVKQEVFCRGCLDWTQRQVDKKSAASLYSSLCAYEAAAWWTRWLVGLTHWWHYGGGIQEQKERIAVFLYVECVMKNQLEEWLNLMAPLGLGTDSQLYAEWETAASRSLVWVREKEESNSGHSRLQEWLHFLWEWFGCTTGRSCALDQTKSVELASQQQRLGKGWPELVQKKYDEECESTGGFKFLPLKESEFMDRLHNGSIRNIIYQKKINNIYLCKDDELVYINLADKRKSRRIWKGVIVIRETFAREQPLGASQNLEKYLDQNISLEILRAIYRETGHAAFRLLEEREYRYYLTHALQENSSSPVKYALYQVVQVFRGELSSCPEGEPLDIRNLTAGSYVIAPDGYYVISRYYGLELEKLGIVSEVGKSMLRDKKIARWNVLQQVEHSELQNQGISYILPEMSVLLYTHPYHPILSKEERDREYVPQMLRRMPTEVEDILESGRHCQETLRCRESEETCRGERELRIKSDEFLWTVEAHLEALAAHLEAMRVHGGAFYAYAEVAEARIKAAETRIEASRVHREAFYAYVEAKAEARIETAETRIEAAKTRIAEARAEKAEREVRELKRQPERKKEGATGVNGRTFFTQQAAEIHAVIAEIQALGAEIEEHAPFLPYPGKVASCYRWYV